MNKLSDIYELFDNFENNRLSKAEKEEFQKRLESDDNFRIEFEQYHDIIVGIKAASEEKLRDGLKELDKSIIDPVIRSTIYYVYRVAATIAVLLIGAAIIYLTKYQESDSDLLTNSPDVLIDEIQKDIIDSLKSSDNSHINPNDNNEDLLLAMNLFDEYFESYPNNLVPQSRGVPTDSLELAMYYYQLDDYKNCLVILTDLLIKNPDNNDLLFYSAICLMNNLEFEQALSHLNKMSNSGTEVYKDEIKWYTALIYLRTTHIDQALDLLNILSSYTNDYKNSSESIVFALSDKKK
ncbi:MAG: hypothetical protein HOD63_15105 [Bacteroidetes bacterium]|jgi:tetratricopeptide (TPR) repeat protein|nr:hypothetical protein [Bacteroidota bacterium]MBT4728952.1 hypothetical protein [Bacteroidota bacterium]MBT5530155.1 hypothetical protein [Cytophagia bacterium]MBT5992345.1 hypothetical protein [Bacteroidota bacterium]MBT6837526.1 hypothetical protein [Bacteroidota bacterium]